jgi:exopolysaccharide biosynthesis polyprenyl glycosylphosphotransferase
MSASSETARTTSGGGDYLFPFLTVLCDILAIESSFLFSYWLRFHSGLFEALGFSSVPPPPIWGYWLGSAVMTMVWALLFASRRMYRPRRRVHLADEFLNIIKSTTIGMLIVMSAAFFYRDFSYSRIVFGLIWISGIVFIFVLRGCITSLMRKLRRRGFYLRKSVLVGGGSLADDVFTKLQHHPSFGFDIEGYFADSDAPPSNPLACLPRLGTLTALPEYIVARDVEIVFIAMPVDNHDRLLELISQCEGVDVEFMMVPDVLDVLTSNVRLTEYEGIPFLTLKGTSMTPWGRVAKRAFDVVVSCLLLVGLSPLLLLVALLVKLTSRGPILYRQERVGLDGRRFSMLKFRSMHQEAEQKTGPVWAEKADPRRTRLGILLRRTSIDELPQLLNVFRGEMSLVGPRPERPHFVDRFKDAVPKYLDRHRMKTGVTGWAQVNGLRGNTSLEERIKYDLYYIENWSFAFDLKILLRTIRAAFVSKRLE